MLEKSKLPTTKVFYALLGAFLASAACSYSVFFFSFNSVSIFWPVFISQLPVVFVLGLGAVILVRFAEGLGQFGVFWIAFLGMFVGFLGALWVDTFIINGMIAVGTLKFGIYINILKTGIGIIAQAVSILIFQAFLRRSRE